MRLPSEYTPHPPLNQNDSIPSTSSLQIALIFDTARSSGPLCGRPYRAIERPDGVVIERPRYCPSATAESQNFDQMRRKKGNNVFVFEPQPIILNLGEKKVEFKGTYREYRKDVKIRRKKEKREKRESCQGPRREVERSDIEVSDVKKMGARQDG